jgi:hypothetical protein
VTSPTTDFVGEVCAQATVKAKKMAHSFIISLATKKLGRLLPNCQEK